MGQIFILVEVNGGFCSPESRAKEFWLWARSSRGRNTCARFHPRTAHEPCVLIDFMLFAKSLHPMQSLPPLSLRHWNLGCMHNEPPLGVNIPRPMNLEKCCEQNWKIFKWLSPNRRLKKKDFQRPFEEPSLCKLQFHKQTLTLRFWKPDWQVHNAGYEVGIVGWI